MENEKTRTYNDVRLAVVTPMANEAESAESFVKEVIKICRPFNFAEFHFFAILDNISKDGTRDILERLSADIPELKVVFAPENKNVVDAYVRGYHEAIASNADWILEMDAGFSHLPDDIPQFFRKMKLGYDCVFGSRFFQGRRTSDTKLTRHIMSKGGSILCKLFLNSKLSDMTSGFELFKGDVLENILSRGILSIGPFFQTEIRTFAHDYNIAEVPIYYGTPSYKFRLYEIYDAFKNLFRLFRLRFTNP